MRRARIVAVAIVGLIAASVAVGQGWPPRNGSALPATCSVDQGFFLTSSTATQFYECTATDTWTHVVPGGGSAWGGITGTLSTQTDLQTALDGKEPAGVSFSELTGAATDAQVPDTITVSLAAAATALAADPADCVTSTHFAVGVTAGGVATCEAIGDADVPSAISRDSEAVAVGDVTGSLSGGYQISAGAVGTAELATAHKTEQWAFTVYDPNGLAATDDIPSIIANRARAVTITEVACESNDGTAVINLQRDDGATADILSANLTCGTGGTSTTGFVAGENAIADGHNVDFVFVSETAVTRVNVVLVYTVD